MFVNYKKRIGIIKLAHLLLSFLFDNKCEICKKSYYLNICPECMGQLTFINEMSTEYINEIPVNSVYFYKGNIRKLLLGIKYNKLKSIATDIAIIMSHYWQEKALKGSRFLVIPIPMSAQKQKHRGYNHVALIARLFATINGYEYNDKILLRNINTIEQHKLNSKERMYNLKNAFSLSKKIQANKPILIIEDIVTTGATISQATQVLIENGCNNIIVLCFSKTELKQQ